MLLFQKSLYLVCDRTDQKQIFESDKNAGLAVLYNKWLILRSYIAKSLDPFLKAHVIFEDGFSEFTISQCR